MKPEPYALNSIDSIFFSIIALKPYITLYHLNITLNPKPRDPSIQIIPTLGPKVCEYYLHLAIWIPRVNLDGSVETPLQPDRLLRRAFEAPLYHRVREIFMRTIQELGFRVQGLRVKGRGFRVYRVQGLVFSKPGWFYCGLWELLIHRFIYGLPISHAIYTLVNTPEESCVNCPQIYSQTLPHACACMELLGPCPGDHVDKIPCADLRNLGYPTRLWAVLMMDLGIFVLWLWQSLYGSFPPLAEDYRMPYLGLGLLTGGW